MGEKLTQRAVDTLPPGTYADSASRGLYLRVTGEGAHRSWLLRRKVDGKRYDVGLGGTRSIPVQKARAEAARLMSMPAADFIAEVRPAKKVAEPERSVRTFKEVCDEFVQWNIAVGNWEELSKSHRVFESRMRCHVWPKIGGMPIDEIAPADLAEIVTPNWHRPDLVDRCLAFSKKVFDWAKAKGYTRRDNPADRRGALQFLLPSTKHVVQNRGALAVKDLPAFFAATLRESQNAARQCFEFSILTATRNQTAREARWEQIDFDEKIWTVPPEQLKVKANGALVVPLAPEVIDFLQSIKRPHEGLVFPNRYGNIMSDTMVGRVAHLTPGKWIDAAETMKRGEEVRPTQHGIARATFMTWSQDDALGNDKRFDVRVAHMCLHHKLQDGYNGAYERQSMFIRRRELMEAWAKYCFSAVPHSARGQA